MKWNARKAIGALILVSVALTVVFTGYSVKAYATSPETSIPTYRTLYRESGEFEHVGYFSNESVYRNGTHLGYYPEKITTLIGGNYTFRTTSGGGRYRVTLHEDYYVTSGKVRVSIINETRTIGEGDFKGSFSVPVAVNLTAIESELDRIRDGTGLYRASVDVYLVAEVRGDGGTFTHRVDLKRDTTGMLSLQGASKDYKKVTRTVNTTSNSVAFLGSDVGVSTARTVFPAMALLFSPRGFHLREEGGEA